MLNWIKFIVVFLIMLTSVITVMVLVNAEKPFSAAKKAAIESAVQSGQLASVSSADVFNGTIPTVTVFGVDADGKEKAVFVDENSKDGFKEVKLTDGISAEKAVANVKKELDVKKVLHVKLGQEEEGPVWEVAFKSDNGKLNYVYVFFENGQWWKRILNL
ncbi:MULTISPECIES: DUF5590 domain-containing protein [unclassified Sporosarcina]|uniref:cell wall elongation regulator TseB-like domain-containing protein n=1 Tax=Sporosarcina TaxID=1569 RepID=UPI00164D3F0A|nr:DUF5590 domain-containing protein [Sporosarcina sp. resist]QNK86540.1 DUF5590 domain-containing protein [Sporosarcina sp. resist]